MIEGELGFLLTYGCQPCPVSLPQLLLTGFSLSTGALAHQLFHYDFLPAILSPWWMN